MSRPDPVVSEAVPAALDGERLDRVVSLLTGMSRRQAAEAVAQAAAAEETERAEAEAFAAAAAKEAAR